ncbi:MAG: sigma-70 family RNA polymerase sigma factor [Prevotellaceae bacterium]|jgi:RNA polymerase sigma-70 factor (ECF subfamily)|nr:sigma-70 family RNA polymerase sigma factor [Prevotellaceae bacterium]
MKYKDDIRYINRVLGGDTSAFSVLVERYQSFVYTIVLKVVGNKEEAEEAAQDAFMKVFGALHTFKGDADFSTWVYRIAYNTGVSKIRQRKHFFVPIDDVTVNESDADFSSENLSIRIAALQAALTKLSRDEQLLVSLYYTEENSIDEVARITGLTGSNVKVRLHRIRKKIYAELKGVNNE